MPLLHKVWEVEQRAVLWGHVAWNLSLKELVCVLFTISRHDVAKEFVSPDSDISEVLLSARHTLWSTFHVLFCSLPALFLWWIYYPYFQGKEIQINQWFCPWSHIADLVFRPLCEAKLHAFPHVVYSLLSGLPRWSAVKKPLASAGDAGDKGLSPGLRRSPIGGNGNSLQYSCLENPMDRRTWQATVHEAAKNQTWQLLSTHAHTSY